MSRIVKRPRLSNTSDEAESGTNITNSSGQLQNSNPKQADNEAIQKSPTGNASLLEKCDKNILEFNPQPLEDSPMTFSAPRAKRWLQSAIKNKYVTMEEVKVQIVLAAHKAHPNFIKDLELGICEISAEFAKFMEEVEILSLASKILPEWINNQQKYHKCNEIFTSK